MRVAVFSDIHSNAAAFKACLSRAEREKADACIFLGDYVSDCADARETMDLLRRTAKDADCVFVRGNREDYLLAHRAGDSNWSYNSQTGSLLYTYEQMTESDLDWFANMPVSLTWHRDGMKDLLLCHGSPASTREHLWEGFDAATRYAREMREEYLLCGHTHHPYIASVAGKTIINTGTVGLPLLTVQKAQFVLMESDAGDWHARFIEVEYDAEEAVRGIERSGMLDKAPGWARLVRQMLLTGECYTMRGLVRVEEIAHSHNDRELKEEYWQQMLSEFKLQ